LVVKPPAVAAGLFFKSFCSARPWKITLPLIPKRVIGDPTLADAILDRLVHNAHRLTLKGDSLRKAAAKRQKLNDEPAN
jgi:hypothetical protein